jgi:hypothetical protein
MEDFVTSGDRVVGRFVYPLVTGEDTAGKCTLIDMHASPGGGPPLLWPVTRWPCSPAVWHPFRRSPLIMCG